MNKNQEFEAICRRSNILKSRHFSDLLLQDNVWLLSCSKFWGKLSMALLFIVCLVLAYDLLHSVTSIVKMGQTVTKVVTSHSLSLDFFKMWSLLFLLGQHSFKTFATLSSIESQVMMLITSAPIIDNIAFHLKHAFHLLLVQKKCTSAAIFMTFNPLGVISFSNTTQRVTSIKYTYSSYNLLDEIAEFYYPVTVIFNSFIV